MLSYNIGTEDFVSRAKKGRIEILKALRTYGCYSCSVFFKLFDAQIVPSLLYAAEIWGHREYKQIEKAHLYACKLFINVPTVTPNDMIYMVSWAGTHCTSKQLQNVFGTGVVC